MYELIVTFGFIWLLFAVKKHWLNHQQSAGYDSHHDFSISATWAFDDDSDCYKTDLDMGCTINPATGLQMLDNSCGGIDIGGNVYGCNSGIEDSWSGIDGIGSSWD